MPAATEKALDREGWLHSGDLATMDEQGYIRMAGRLKEVIQKGTETIFPVEVEEVLLPFLESRMPKFLEFRIRQWEKR